MSFSKGEIWFETLEVSFCEGQILPKDFLRGGIVKNQQSNIISSIHLRKCLKLQDQYDYQIGTNSFFEINDNFLYCRSSNQEDLWAFPTDGFVFGNAADDDNNFSFCGLAERNLRDSEIYQRIIEE